MPVRTTETTWVTRRWLDVPYATMSLAPTLEVYRADGGDGHFPPIVGIHGGAFRMGTSRNRETAPIVISARRGRRGEYQLPDV